MIHTITLAAAAQCVVGSLFFAASPTPPKSPPITPPAAGAPAAKDFAITSPGFTPGEQIPKKHTVDGEDVSPPLAWSNPPVGTRSFAIIMEDPFLPPRPAADTPEQPARPPRNPWVHWVVYNIPPTAAGLPESVARLPEVAEPAAIAGIRQGKTSWGTVGYRGPAGRKGSTHTYRFILYALDTELDLKHSATKAELLEAIEGHVLAQTQVSVTNTR